MKSIICKAYLNFYIKVTSINEINFLGIGRSFTYLFLLYAKKWPKDIRWNLMKTKEVYQIVKWSFNSPIENTS